MMSDFCPSIAPTIPINRTTMNKKSGAPNFSETIAITFLLYLMIAYCSRRLPPLALGIYVVASVVAFVTYFLDKRAAKHGDWRIRESTLHWIALFGGWPGAVAAQRFVRHKTGKPSFQRVFMVCVIVNIFCFILYSSTTVSNFASGLMH
jgi:uncharacterized membrane protein YsdA (DUF1294 family)